MVPATLLIQSKTPECPPLDREKGKNTPGWMERGRGGWGGIKGLENESRLFMKKGGEGGEYGTGTVPVLALHSNFGHWAVAATRMYCTRVPVPAVPVLY